MSPRPTRGKRFQIGGKTSFKIVFSSVSSRPRKASSTTARQIAKSDATTTTTNGNHFVHLSLFIYSTSNCLLRSSCYFILALFLTFLHDLLELSFNRIVQLPLLFKLVDWETAALGVVADSAARLLSFIFVFLLPFPFFIFFIFVLIFILFIVFCGLELHIDILNLVGEDKPWVLSFDPWGLRLILNFRHLHIFQYKIGIYLSFVRSL